MAKNIFTGLISIMKIAHISGNIKRNLGILGITGLSLLFAGQPIKAQNLEKTPDRDLFEKNIAIPPKGTKNDTVLLSAPSPEIEIAGVKDTARIVVDLSKNVLYTYNENGQAECAYLIASGKPKYPTDTGIRVVTHIESYPYRSAPQNTRRYSRPNDYGPKIICLEKIDPKTGEHSLTGEFIHGNNNPDSIGKYASLGCIRMDNDVIRALSKRVKRGDIVVITK